MTPQQQIIVPLIATSHDFIVNAQSIIALDLSHYTQGVEGRRAQVFLVAGHTHIFENERADEFYVWYLNFTGQNRIQQATPTPLKLT